MTNLITLGCSDQLLQILPEQINHLIICPNSEYARDQLHKNLTTNKDVISMGEQDDNIVKIELKGISLFRFDCELDKIKAVKQLINFIDFIVQTGKCYNIYEGFFYYSLHNKKVQYYRIFNQSNFTCVRMPVLQVSAIVSHLLLYSSSLKDFIQKWLQIALKKTKFKPEMEPISKLNAFLMDIFNKSITSVKMANHSLQIIIQKLQGNKNGIQDSCQFTGMNKNRYENLKINIQCKQTPCRLKQSSSMTNLSSSSKNRKYKKQTPKKNVDSLFKQLKQNKNKITKDTWESNMSYFRNTTNSKIGSFLKTNDQNFIQKCQRQNAFMQSFSQVNKMDMQKISISQSNLYQLLEKKENIRKNNSNFSYIKENSNQHIQKSLKDAGFQNKKYLQMCPKVISIRVEPTIKPKRHNLNSCLYSINQSVACSKKSISQKIFQPQQTLRKSEKKFIPNKQTQNIRSNDQVEFQTKKLTKMENSVPTSNNDLTTHNFSMKNCTFLFQTIQILCQDKFLRKYSFISLYAMYIFYFYCAYNTEVGCEQVTEKHKMNLSAIGSKTQLFKTNNGLSNPESLNQLQYLLGLSKSLSPVSLSEKTKIKQSSLNILLKQFERNKSQIIKQKNELIKNNKFKAFLVYMMRLAISISVIRDVSEQNCGVNDFPRYESLIMLQKKNNVDIDLMAEIRNCEMLI